MDKSKSKEKLAKSEISEISEIREIEIEKLVGRPECYESNDDRYPLCVGKSLECKYCQLYERYGIRGL